MENKIKIVLMLTILVLIFTALIGINRFGKTEKTKTEEMSIQLKSMAMQFNTSWKKIEKKEDYSKLEHINYDATVETNKYKLPNEYTECDIEEIAEIVLENIEEQYTSYKLLAREKEIVKEKEFYKILFVDQDYQALIVIYKENVNLFLTSYVASNEIFDILLDEALVMIYNIEYLDETYEIPEMKLVETTGINWGTEEVKKFENKKEKEIYYDTYHAVISVPEEFVEYEFSSKDFHYVYSGISIIGSIQAKNIYEYIISDIEDTNLKQEYEYLQKYYENVTVESEFEKNRYIYMFNYNNENTSYQDAYIVYPLDNTHVLKIAVSARNNKISKNLIDAIQLKEFDRYAQNIVYKSEKDGKNTFDFLIYDKSYNTGIYYEIKLHLPKKYKEIDNNVNNQINRYFGDKYNSDKDEYLYNIQTQLFSNRANKTNEKYINELCPTRAQNVVIEKRDAIVTNDNVFDNYYLKYSIPTNAGLQTYEFSLLFLDISENIYIVSKIDLANVEDISEIIEDFTDITYTKKIY